MEIINDPKNPEMNSFDQRRRRGRMIFGSLIVGIGVLLLLSKLGVNIPQWALSWEIILIAVGLAIGIKHNFTRIGWIIPVLVGSVFLAGDFFPNLINKTIILPIIVIIIGAFMIFKPSHRRHYRCHHHYDCQ